MSNAYTDTAVALGAFLVHNQSTDSTYWFDESGNDLDGTRVNSPTWTSSGGPGVDVPGYFSFNGSNQSIDLGNPSLLNLDGVDPVTFVYWARQTVSTQPVYTQVIGKGNAPGYQVFRTGPTTDSTIMNFDLQYTSWVISTTGFFPVDTWTMFMSRWDGTELTLWKIIGGVATLAHTTVASGTSNAPNNSKFLYGAQDRTHTGESTRRFWDGDLAGVAAFPTSLSGEEMELLYVAATEGAGEVTGLTVTPGVGTATLSWSETGASENTIIYRDSVQVATVAWGIETWTSGSLPDGLYSWTIAPQGGSQSSPVVRGCMTADVYVDPVSGNNANNGTTPALAVQTINEAGTLVTTSGKTIALRGGTYDEYNSRSAQSGGSYGGAAVTTLTVAGTALARNYIKGFPGEIPILDGSSIDRVVDMGTGLASFGPMLLEIAANYWTVQGWSMEYPIVARYSAGAGFSAYDRDFVHFRNVHSHGHQGHGIYVPLSDGAVVENFATWDLYCAEYPGSSDGVNIVLARNSIVRDGVVMWPSDDGVDFIATASADGNHLVERVVVYGAGKRPNNDLTGGDSNGFKLGGNATPLNNIARNCIAVDCGVGFNSNDAGGITVEYCSALYSRNRPVFLYAPGSHVARHNLAFDWVNPSSITGTSTYNSWESTTPTPVSGDFVNLTFDTAIRSWDDFVESEYGKLTTSSLLRRAGVLEADLGFEGFDRTLSGGDAPLRVTTTGAGQASDPLVISAPPFMQEGDLILIGVYAGNASSDVTCPGFTREYRTASNGGRQTLLWKWATSSEPSTYDLDDIIGYSKTAAAIAYRGVNPTTPFEGMSQNLTSDRVAPSRTSLGANRKLIGLWSYTGAVLGAPSGMRERQASSHSTARILLADETVGSGSTGTRTATGDTTNGVWGTILLMPTGTAFTLTPNGQISVSGMVNEIAGTTNLHLSVDEETSDGDTTYIVNSEDTSAEVVFSLTGAPVDLASLLTLSIQIRARNE